MCFECVSNVFLSKMGMGAIHNVFPVNSVHLCHSMCYREIYFNVTSRPRLCDGLKVTLSFNYKLAYRVGQTGGMQRYASP